MGLLNNSVIFVLLAVQLMLAQQALAATSYCTYHSYESNFPTSAVACSDGANGLQTKLGLWDISTLFPYVSSWSHAGWNSPNCGACLKLTNVNGGNSVYVTVIDQCGATAEHFDMAPPAFTELFGSAGVAAGSGNATWQVVASSNCKGNKGGSSLHS